MEKNPDKKPVTQNKKAYHDYFVLEKYEAGIELFGTEVKSIRQGKINLKDAWCSIKNGEIFVNGMHIIPYEQEFTEKSRVMEILSGTDILKREKALDDLMWEKADSLILMDLFDIDVILAFIAKLKIADRWHKPDEGTGREMFRHLVNEIRNTR